MTTSALSHCRCCAEYDQLEAGICARCKATYGLRLAALLARAQADADFASACLARLPADARAEFAALLSARCLTRPKHLGPGLHSTAPRVQRQAFAAARLRAVS